MIPFLALLLTWNPTPRAVEYRVWRGIDVVAVVTDPQIDINLPLGESTITVTARNSYGESPHSSELVLDMPLLNIECSNDLVIWFDIPTTDAYAMIQRRPIFFRIKKRL